MPRAARTCNIRPDARFFPGGARLWDWRKHCEDAHGAGEADYKLNVVGWHRNHAPDCEWTPDKEYQP